MVRLRALPISIPCVLFEVRAHLSEASGLTPVERVTLKAIGAGLDTVAELALALSLGQRLLLDLIYDFWLKGYVVIDTDTARVQLVGDAESAYRDGDWSRLPTAENNIVNVNLLQELVSGAVLPNVGRQTPQSGESTLAPTLMSGLELDVIKRQTLLDALRDAVARQSRQTGRPLTVREAWVDPDRILDEGAQRGHPRRYLSLLVDVVREPSGGDLTFEVVDADVGPVIRRGIEKQLTQLSRRLPNHLFFKQLHARFERDAPDDGRDREDILVRLERAVRGLDDDVDPGVLEQRHAALAEFHGEAQAELAALALAQAEVRPLIGHAAHRAALRRMLAEARHQIVIGNPWLRLDVLVEPGPDGVSWFDMFARALDRGVQIVLFWGVSIDSTLEAPVLNALVQLRERHQQRFIWSTRPSVSHAKFVVCDACEALITSFNFFKPAPDDESLEIGVTVTGRSPAGTTGAVLDLLRWARNAFPDHMLGRRILVLAEELDASEPAAPALPAPLRPDPHTPELRGPAIRHWARAWHDTVDALRRHRRELRHRAELLVDGMHREDLTRALRRSEHRLVILSDRLGIDVVNDRFVADLRARLAQRVPCALMFRRPGATDSAAGPAARVQQLADEFPEFSLTMDRSHAKLLVSDHEAVIGSFNFLSYSGEHDRPGRPGSSELSVRVGDPDVVQGLLTALAERWPAAFTRLAASHGPRVALPAFDAVPSALQPLFHKLQHGDGRGDVLLRWFAGSDAWSDLDALRDAGVDESLLVQAVGAALAGATFLASAAGRRWQRWLAEQRWRSGDFIGCALLVPPGDAGPAELPPWLANAGAAVQTGSPLELPIVISGAAHSAAVLLAIADTLLHGRDPSALLHDLMDLPRPVQRWVAGVREHHAATREPLPLLLLARQASAAHQQQATLAAREALRAALESAEQIGFRFSLGQHTWERLRGQGQFLGELRTALVSNDPSMLARYLDDLDRTNPSPEALMDAASLVVRDSHVHRIEGPKRGACLRRLQLAHRAARGWIATALSQPLQSAERHQLVACWRLRRALAELPTTPMDGLAEPVRAYLAARLRPLFEAEER